MRNRLVIPILLLTFAFAHAQKPPTPKPTTAKPTAEQAEFAAAGKALEAGEFAGALTGFKQLIQQHPENPQYRKFAAEAALHAGDPAFALATLAPVEAAHPNDWRARLLLARAYAQTAGQTAGQTGQTARLDDELAALRKLHASLTDPAFTKLQEFLLETDHAGDTTVQFYPALVPWGGFNFALVGRTYDAQEQPGQLLVLESDDGDQELFAKEHPQEAAAGLRSFSLDGYLPPVKNDKGEDIQTHYTYGFFIGEPSYEAIHAQMLAIAAGTQKPISRSTNPVQ